MQSSLDKVDLLADELKNLQPIEPAYQKKLDKKFRLEFNYNSNHMEGNTLTYGETELLLIFDDTTGNHSMREYEEMKAHDVAYKLVEEWAKDKERPLTEQGIKNLNEIILVRPFWKDAITPSGQNTRRQIIVGNYKEQPNSVRLPNGEIFDYASPSETPFLMQELIDWYREEENHIHPVTLAAMLHYKFVRIHPFDDGNGRVSRLLMNYVLLKNELPPVIIKSADKRNYLSALHFADIGNYEPIIEYVAQQVVWSLEISVKAAKGENIDEVDDLDKELTLLKTELKGQNILTAVANSENISNAIEQNIIPLFRLLEEKCESLKDLFFDTERRIEFEISGESGRRLVGTKDSKWEELIENWLTNQVRAQGQMLKIISLNYKLAGFKGKISADSFWLNIDVRFDDYNYTLTTYTSSAVQIPYNKRLTYFELLQYVTPIVKNLIENIKQLNGHKND